MVCITVCKCLCRYVRYVCKCDVQYMLVCKCDVHVDMCMHAGLLKLHCRVQLNMLSKYLEGHTKSILLIRGTYYQYWLT